MHRCGCACERIHVNDPVITNNKDVMDNNGPDAARTKHAAALFLSFVPKMDSALSDRMINAAPTARIIHGTLSIIVSGLLSAMILTNQ